MGYVGEINERQLVDNKYQDIKIGDFIGQSGIERLFNSMLTGVDGGKQVEADAQGRELRILAGREPVPGSNLVLTIDSRLQLLAEKLLEGKNGAIVALNPKNGNVLCLVSKPSFDPNKFSVGISRAEWKKMLTELNNPLQNRVIQSQYPPGSVFKILMAAAALEENIINRETVINCGGSFRLGRWKYACWKKIGHGAITIHEAIVHSCNVFFYTVGKRLGIDRISRWSYKMGLGRATGIELPNEKSGLVPTASWKLKRFGEKWQGGETISLSIGQGFLAVTPIQMANLVSMIANGGTLYKPRLVQRIISPDGKIKRSYYPEVLAKLKLSASTFDIVHKGLYGVVNEYGTGRKAQIEGLDVAGKTGTAQVVRKRNLPKIEYDKIPEKLQDHAWFAAFAPVDNAEIAIAILVEHGGHGGSACAPIAREIIKEYFNLKTIESEKSDV